RELFEGMGPLATFSAKIKLGYALGFYGPRTRHDFLIFNEIRNAFAHAPHPLTFKNKSIANRTTGLFVVSRRLKTGDIDPGREAFANAIRHYSVIFTMLPHPRSGKTAPLYSVRGRSALK